MANTLTLSTLKRGQYAKFAGEILFLGLGNGAAFQIELNGKCIRTDISCPFITDNTWLTRSDKVEFDFYLERLKHDGDYFSMLCANAAKNFIYEYAY